MPAFALRVVQSMKSKRVCAFAAALFLGALTAEAATVFTLTGTGTVIRLKADGSQAAQQIVGLVGTATFDVHGVPDMVGPDTASGLTWVSSSFQLSWTGQTPGSFSSDPVAGPLPLRKERRSTTTIFH